MSRFGQLVCVAVEDHSPFTERFDFGFEVGSLYAVVTRIYLGKPKMRSIAVRMGREYAFAVFADGRQVYLDMILTELFVEDFHDVEAFITFPIVARTERQRIALQIEEHVGH